MRSLPRGVALVTGIAVAALPLALPAGGVHAEPADGLAMVLRWLGLCALATAVGGLAVAGPILAGARAGTGSETLADAVRVARRRALAVAGGGAALAAGVGLVAATVAARRVAAGTGGSLPAVAADLLAGTRWGHLWLATEAALVALVVLAFAARTGRESAGPVQAAGAIALVLIVVWARALGGHAGAVGSSRTAALVADTVHVLTALLWLGVPAVLALAAWPAVPRPRRAELLRACRGPVVGWVVLSATLLAATGLYSAGRQVVAPGELLTTSYGRTLLVKAALLAVLAGFGLLHAARLYGRRSAVLGDLLGPDARRLVLAEAAVGASLLVAAGVLAGSSAPRERPPGPVAAPVMSTAMAADLVVSLSVTPNRPGQNVFSARVASSRRPPPAPVEAVGVRAGGPAIALREVEPGRYLGTGRLDAAGPAEVTIVVSRAGESLSARVPWRVPPASGQASRPPRRLAPYANAAAIGLLLCALAVRARWLIRRAPDAQGAPGVQGSGTAPGGSRRGGFPMSRAGPAAALAVLLALPAAAPGPGPAAAAPVREPMVAAVVVLRSQADLTPARAVRRKSRPGAAARILRAHADRTQRGLRDLLRHRRAQGLVASVQPLWIVDAIAVVAAPSVIGEVTARPEVREVRPDLTVPAPQAMAGAAEVSAAESNLEVVNTRAMWDLGLRGQGIVVANMDTGVDAGHPDLSARWRGGTNSWYDPNGQHPTTPTDVNGHGTWTMGVLAGGGAGGPTVGVAPEATWIAVKIFNDRGIASSTRIHQGFQWLLDPDGDPGTADAPDVVNNSWTLATPGCLLDFQPDLANLRAAGILPIFAAGNYGPLDGSARSPADNPEAFSVGAVDDADAVDGSSGRGPSACGQPVYPRLRRAGGRGPHHRPVRPVRRGVRHFHRGPARRRRAGPAPAGVPRPSRRTAGRGAGSRRRRSRAART